MRSWVVSAPPRPSTSIGDATWRHCMFGLLDEARMETWRPHNTAAIYRCQDTGRETRAGINQPAATRS